MKGNMFDAWERNGYYLGKSSDTHNWCTVLRYLETSDKYRAQARIARPARWVHMTVKLAAGAIGVHRWRRGVMISDKSSTSYG